MALAIAGGLPRIGMAEKRAAHPRPWQKLLLILGLMWALAIVIPDVYRLYWPLGSLGFSADNGGRIYDVYDDPAASAGLRDGDRIRLELAPCRHPIANPQCGDFLAVFGGMGGLTYVRETAEIALPIVRDGQRITVHLKANPAYLGHWAQIILALDELFAVYVLWRAFRLVWDRFIAMTLGFFLYVMWFNPGQYFAFYAWLQGHSVGLLAQEALQAVAQGAGYAGFLIFALRFPRNETEPQFRGLERAAYLLGAVLAALQLISFLNVFGYPTEAVTRTAILGGYAVAASGLWIVWHRRKLQKPLDYQRMRWVLWGCLIGIPAFIFADSNEATSLWDRFIWPLAIWHGWTPTEAVLEFGYFLSGLFAVLVCEAVRHPRIGNISYELRRLITVGVVGTAFAALEIWAEQPIDGMLARAHLSTTWHFPIELIAVLIIGAIGDRGADVTDRLISRPLRRAITSLQSAGRRAEDAASIEDIDAILVNAPADALRLASAVVYRDIGGVYCAVASRPADETARPEFQQQPDAILLQKLEAGHAVPLALRSSEVETEAALAAPTIAIPVMTGAKFEAIVYYGAHETGDDVAKTEVRALESFAQQIAMAYDAVRIGTLEREIESLRRQLGQSPRPAAQT